MVLSEPRRLRGEVREFLRDQLARGTFTPHCNSWMTQFSPAFSRLLAEQGWLGLTWPEEYGGHGGTPNHRLVVTEELLAHGAPVAAHWIADRQMGPNLLAFGSERLKAELLPQIARAETFFCIGMSEPDSGSDLASVRTRAVLVDGGWSLTGTKVWTTGAHIARFMMTLARTRPTEQRHAGLSQLVVDLTSPGVTIAPIISMNGDHHFNEVVLDNVFVPASHLVGSEGAGWRQVTAELAFERSGPERYMSTVPLLTEWARQVATASGNLAAKEDVGLLAARLWALRQSSAAISRALAAGESPVVDAAKVKDLGALFERDVIATVRRHRRSSEPCGRLERLLAESILEAPTFTLRGGTPEILRGVVARDLGVR
jgi:alkylation response protein AidB-like acyl-CoA dehydrogenase